MSPEQTIYDTLRLAAAVIALVGDRIHPDLSPQEESMPAITYERLESVPELVLDGSVAATRAGMQVVCWSETRVEAEAVADAVIDAMLAAGIPPAGRASDFDVEIGRAAVAVNFDIWY